MRFHFVSAHFGSPRPWPHHIYSSHEFTSIYYDDLNTASRHNAMHPRLKSKIPKMLEWQRVSADWYIWMDSSIRLKKHTDIPRIILETCCGKPLCLFRHTKVSSIQEEVKYIVEGMSQGNSYLLDRFSGEPITEQLKIYLDDNSFLDVNLFQMSFFAYHRSAAPLMQEWFLHNCIWSIKDQISFPYVLSKSGLSYSCFEGSVLENSMFHWDWKSREQKSRSTVRKN